METFLKQAKAPRIKEERKKLNLTQSEIAEKCGVKRLQWIRYEKGEQDLSGEVLAEFAKHGADVTYILTGQRSQLVALPADEEMLLDNYRSLSADKKKMVLQFLLGGFDSLNHPTKGVVNSPNTQVLNSFNA